MKNNMTVAQEKELLQDALNDINHVINVLNAYFSDCNGSIPGIENDELRQFRLNLNVGYVAMAKAIDARYGQ